MGKGIFGDLFDFDNDGKLDAIEQAADFIAFKELSKDESDFGDFHDSEDYVDYGDYDDEYEYGSDF